jgi:hypothetical protein
MKGTTAGVSYQRCDHAPALIAAQAMELSPMPLSFDDQQLELLRNTVLPLSNGARVQFMAAIEAEFSGRTDIPNAELRAACEKYQRELNVGRGVDGRLNPRRGKYGAA